MLASHDLEQILILRKTQAKISELARGVRSPVAVFRDLKTIRNTVIFNDILLCNSHNKIYKLF